jgi:hypothetical protein
MPVSVLLVRWNGGWHEYRHLASESLFGRSEAFLSLGAAQSVEEARRLARAELVNQFGKIREQITAEHRPEDVTKIPYVAYKPGDSKITAPNYLGVNEVYTVNSMTVTEDDDGVITFVPGIGDNILGVEEFQSEIRSTFSRGKTAGPA